MNWVKRLRLIVAATMLATSTTFLLLKTAQGVGSVPPLTDQSRVGPASHAPPHSPSALPVKERLFLAFYYPWYRLDYWSNPQMLDTPLFPYNSSEPLAIARHITWTQDAGLDGLIVSWWGSEDTFIDDNFVQVLDQMSGTGLRATIYFETYGPNFDSSATVINELEYVLDTYGSHPNFLTYDGRPVIFLFAVHLVAREAYETPHQAWQTIVGQLHADGYDPFLIGDNLDPIYLDIFDGLHPYLARQDVDYYQNIACDVHRSGGLWAADIYPGYDDRLLDRPNPFHIPREDGQVYSDTLDAAFQSDPDWILVTSFNEWWENTHIEPGVTYGYDYISQTARLAERFHAWRALSSVHVNAVHAGPEDGSATHPYNTLQEAMWAANDGATLHVAGGVYSGPITLTRSITLEGGYEPIGWTRDLSANPTLLIGEGNGPIVRVQPSFCNSPSIALDGLTITDGSASGANPSGGGVRLQDASLRLANSIITSNHAQQKGGGIFVTGDSQLTLYNSQLLSNTANSGGGLFVEGQSSVELVNTVIAGNRVTIAGGGLYLGPDVSASIVNGTLSRNDAPGPGRGIYVWPLVSRAVTVTNSILWGNGDHNLTASGANLSCHKNCTVTYSDVAGGWPGTGNLDADPLFRDAIRHDYHLRHDSPAINLGDPSGVKPLGPAPAVDWEGDPRPLGSGVDLGADESRPLAASTLSVDKTVAQPGDHLIYTLTLTSSGTTEIVSVRVTDALPAVTAFVSDSLRASGGNAAYLAPTGTLSLPRILWTGTVTPGQATHLSFAVTITDDDALYCNTVTNTARIQSDGVVVERSVATRVSDGALQYIAVQDAPHSAGNPVGARALQTGDNLTLYAGGYDACNGYLGPVAATWQTSGTLEFQGGWGDVFTFAPTLGERQGTIVADDGQGHTDQTGLLTVTYAPPHIQPSPSSLMNTQFTDRIVTQPLTISNGPGLTLTYAIATGPQPFEVTYEWDEDLVIQAHNQAWDYYFTPERMDRRFAGAEVQVNEVTLQSGGTNLASWINWDEEIHLSNQAIGLPAGQQDHSPIDPWQGYQRQAPVQLLLTIGEEQNTNSYVYEAEHNFITGATTVFPFYREVKHSLSTPIPVTDALHVQLGFWTGDPRVTLQFNDLQLTVRGIVTYTWADWLTIAPPSGTLGFKEHQVLDVVYSSEHRVPDDYHTAIPIVSNDPHDPMCAIPVTMRVAEEFRSYLPLVVKSY